MPMNPELYPDDWDEIAAAVKDGAGWECMVCGLQCRRPDEPFDTQARTLTVSHWFNEYLTPETFLVACCPKCHNRHDALYRVKNRRKNRRERQRAAGQLGMFEWNGISD